jgi:AraC-like DNA-binding protein
VLCTALDGDVLATDAPTRPSLEWKRCRSVFVPANTVHIMRFSGRAIACLYADPAAPDVATIARDMGERAGKLLVRHRHEDGLARVLGQYAARAISRESLQRSLLDLLGLSEPEEPTDERVARAIQAIREQPSKPHSLRSLAAEVGISESRLRHAFKDATGVPVRRFRLWVRISTALRMVQQGATLTEAALDSGFSSSAHLSNAYRGMFGMTPSEVMEAERQSRELTSPRRSEPRGARALDAAAGLPASMPIAPRAAGSTSSRRRTARSAS